MLFMFHNPPCFDLIMAKPLYESSIMAVGCYGQKMRQVVDDLSAAIHFVPQRPDDGFITSISQAVAMEFETYKGAKLVAHKVGLCQEEMFGLMHYAYFLKTYNNVRNASEVATKRFGVPAGTIPKI